MATPTISRSNGTRGSNGQTGSLATLDISALSAVMDQVTYGAGGKPIYDLLAQAGSIKTINTPDKAVDGTDFFHLRDKALKIGQAAFITGRFDNVQVAIRVSKDELMFAGVLHDKDGNPNEDVDLVVCAVQLNKSFDVPGTEITLEKGTKFLKALPMEYVQKLNKAA